VGAPEHGLAQRVGGAAAGSDPRRRTLVLYDSTGEWSWLGEAYAVQTANLVSHGSGYVMHPVAEYRAGELSGYTGVVYVGSTYDEPLPLSFLDDVLAGSRPVLWMNDNIWQLAQRAPDFAAAYGWSPQAFETDQTTTVTYKDVELKRDPLAVPSGLLRTAIYHPDKATVLATATRSDGSTLAWAVRSPNLTYIGEIPFSYVGPDDRYFAAADLISGIANPAGRDRHRALVRVEDVGPDADPGQLRAIADYLHSRNVPFTVASYPVYVDPNGVNNGGVPRRIRLAEAPEVVDALRYMRARGGTILMHGYTHQYAGLSNPYNGVSADDFEFYRAHIDGHDNVAYDGPVAEDSTSWAAGRVTAASAEFAAAGLAPPTIFEPPHYAASAVDYKVFNSRFGVRYDRGFYAAGWCQSGTCGSGTPDYAKTYGQYFPYLVRDVYGSAVVPEDLGNIEPTPLNNHPTRRPADILASAHRLTVVRDGVQSFFYHPYLGTDDLARTVEGIQGMGYQFVDAATIMRG
jgi:uncharacterized protein YdaL